MSTFIGDRHQGDLNGKLQAPTKSGRVRVSASSRFASTRGGQHLLWMLVNLLARQYGVVTTIELGVPPVPLHGAVALFGAQDNLRDTLVDLGRLVGAGQVGVEIFEPHDARDFVAVETVDTVPSVWAGTADGWTLSFAPQEVMESAPESPLSIGPYFAATLLSGEVFKTIRQFDARRRKTSAIQMSLWSSTVGEQSHALGHGPATLALPPTLYLVGCGAVGQALAATLLSSQTLPKRIITIDHDPIDDELTNLNRYCLASPADKGKNKAELLSDLFKKAGIDSPAFNRKWAEYVQSSADRVGLPEDLLALEREYRFEHVVSCVDKNVSRHEIQKMWPRFIVGGSTLGLSATTQLYDLGAAHECLMCSNPLEDESWTVEAERERLLALTDDELGTEVKRLGGDLGAIKDHLHNPKCGTLGEAEIRRFAQANSPHDWSVGFVSVASGVMLAAALVRYFSDGWNRQEPNALRFSFESCKLGRSQHRASDECECRLSDLKYWRRLWS